MTNANVFKYNSANVKHILHTHIYITQGIYVTIQDVI